VPRPTRAGPALPWALGVQVLASRGEAEHQLREALHAD
jgi:hypothetical protein